MGGWLLSSLFPNRGLLSVLPYTAWHLLVKSTKSAQSLAIAGVNLAFRLRFLVRGRRIFSRVGLPTLCLTAAVLSQPGVVIWPLHWPVPANVVVPSGLMISTPSGSSRQAAGKLVGLSMLFIDHCFQRQQRLASTSPSRPRPYLHLSSCGSCCRPEGGRPT